MLKFSKAYNAYCLSRKLLPCTVYSNCLYSALSHFDTAALEDVYACSKINLEQINNISIMSLINLY